MYTEKLSVKGVHKLYGYVVFRRSRRRSRKRPAPWDTLRGVYVPSRLTLRQRLVRVQRVKHKQT